MVEAVVVEHGARPNDDVCRDLQAASANGGSVDIDALTTGQRQPVFSSGFRLFRVGDAVAGRGIAASIYEARRLCQLL